MDTKKLMTLYEFLGNILSTAKASGGTIHLIEEEVAWLEAYLAPADFLINFKAHKVGETEKKEPIYRQDYQIVGDGADVFCLISEAMLQNHQFAEQILTAASFYKDHVPKCPDCSKRHFGQKRPVMNWNFQPHKQTDK